MNKLVALFALTLIVSFGAFAQPEPSVVSLKDASAIASLPTFVQDMLAVHHEYIEDIDYAYTWRFDVITWGTGTYRFADGHEVLFEWVSYKNDDDSFQIKLNVRVFGFDLAPIRAIRDTLGRNIYETEVDNQHYWTTYIRASNDWGFDAGMYPDGRKTGLVDEFPADSDSSSGVDMVAVTRYYLSKISSATPALQFEVKGAFVSK
jgi:hypothetical protein